MAEGKRRRVRLRVRRQDALEKPATRRWEEFEIDHEPGMTVHDCLEAIRRRPVTAGGAQVAPVAWEASCLEETCGACTMTIDGKVRHACSALVDEISPKGGPITLAPLSKFPVDRDLVVDRARIFDGLARVMAWVHAEGPPSARSSPESPEVQSERIAMSPCIACGACLEACPEYRDGAAFVGPLAINQVRLKNAHPVGALEKRRRLATLMGDGGVQDCGKAQNCVEVCPKGIPLVESIGDMSRATTLSWLFGWFGR